MSRLKVLCLLLATALPLQAQTLSSLQVGARVRLVTTQGRIVEADLGPRTADSVSFKPFTFRSRMETISRASVYSVEMRQPDRVLGFVAGSLAGAAGALIANSTRGPDRAQLPPAAYVLGVVGGGLFGALLNPIDRWVRIPPQ